jgi:rRNA maturation protein Nop10
MGRSICSKRSILAGMAILVLGVLIAQCNSVSGQTHPERFRLAGRYDGNRVIIYFDAVKFNKTVPPNAPRMVNPVAVGFFQPVELPASYIANFLKEPDAYRFALGEEYDVLTSSTAISVKLTTLVGTEGDEEVGNDSYIGALATVTGECPLPESNDYYAVRRHQEPVCGSKAQPGHPIRFSRKFATLVNEPVRFDVQTQIVSLLTQRMMSTASDLQRHAAEGHSPAFAVQPFRVADGSLRYYATAQWKSGARPARSDFSLGAWIASGPTLRILAVEANQNVNLPRILNVANLGGGETGIILANGGEDSISTDLVEYRDGLDVAHMRTLQSIAAGE